MRRTLRAATWIAPAALAAALLYACNSDSAMKSGPAASLTIVSGNDQKGVVATVLPQAFVVKVADTSGVGVPNVRISWALAGGTGTLSAPTSTTDNSGRASVTLTLGDSAGTRSTTATTTAVPVGANRATFIAIAGAPQTRDDWITYGHDAKRTSASQGSINAPLSKAWRFAPPPPTSDPYTVVFDALAAADGVYLQWGSKGSFFGFGTGTNVDRVSPAGARMWSNTSWGADFNDGHWGSIYGTKFVYQDDGLGFLDLQTGVRASYSKGVDWWGETLPDASGLYISQNWHVDGPQAFIGTLSASGVIGWQQNKYGVTKEDISVADNTGGLALSNGVLFFDPTYYTSGTPTFTTGVYAFNAATGARSAFASTTPQSHVSADATRIYLLEGTSGTSIVARAQSDLHVVWSTGVSGALPQTPVLANGLVIVGTGTNIQAFDAVSGAKVWTSSTSPSLTAYSSGVHTTYLAAALGSGTLVATAYDGVYLFSLQTGVQLWKGTVAGISGTAHDPVIVNDPGHGSVLYVVDDTGLIALTGPANELLPAAGGN
jgi:hypothetical protein